jgi:isochorismate synthase
MKKKRKAEMEQQLSDSNSLLIQCIEHLLDQQFKFVVFKYPLASEIRILVETPASKSQVFSLQSFNGKQNEEIKGRLFEDKAWEGILNLRNGKPLALCKTLDESYMSQDSYETYVADIVKLTKTTSLIKSVAARKKKFALPASFNPAMAFFKMTYTYGPTFVYLANTSLGLWLGASPELLMFKKGERSFTVSLAGTKLVKDKSPWTEKDKVEQQIVTDYIIDTVRANGASFIHTSPTFDVHAGHIKHLKTDIEFSSIPNVQELLHPTPAVCGLPREAAKEIIAKYEKNNRSLYSGFLGLNGDNTSYYVNLRCMRIHDKHADVFVGAGITADSNPEQEWLETEAKADVMKKILEE